MRRLLSLLGGLVLATGIATTMTSAHAAGSHQNTKGINWGQHDTAVYVVSTLNLLRTSQGQAMAQVWMRRLGIAEFDVYADTSTPNTGMYFIELRKADGAVFGALAYQIGWKRPMGVTASMKPLHVPVATAQISSMYRTDSKVLLESFTSTQPV